jgi:hypothetical protein
VAEEDARAEGFLVRSAALVDGVLRGSRGTSPDRPPGERVPSRDALLLALPLAAIYGLCMGLAAGWAMALLVMVKIPLILFLGIVICFPSFYVFAALTGARIDVADSLRTLAGYALLTSVVWAALAPVTGFFTVSTDPSSGFIAVLHGCALGLGIVAGLVFVGKEMLAPTQPEPDVRPIPIDEETGEPEELPPPPPGPERSLSVGFFLIWILVYVFVVCQLFADFAPYLEEGPFFQERPRFFLAPDGWRYERGGVP